MIDYSRDNARTPMIWDDSLNGGFSSATPWLRVNSDYKEVNVKNNLEKEDSLFHFYQKLIKLRKEDEVLRRGKYVPLYMHDSKVFAYKRVLDNKEVVVIANFFDKVIKRKFLKEYSSWNMLLSNYSDNDEIVLKPYEVRIMKVEK